MRIIIPLFVDFIDDPVVEASDNEIGGHVYLLTAGRRRPEWVPAYGGRK